HRRVHGGRGALRRHVRQVGAARPLLAGGRRLRDPDAAVPGGLGHAARPPRGRARRQRAPLTASRPPASRNPRSVWASTISTAARLEAGVVAVAVYPRPL